MQELLRNAWLGWQRYTDNGKIAALLLTVLLFLWFGKKEIKSKGAKWLLVYTTCMVICCIFPVSAAVLMKYQTRFYDYEWIWSYVPVTMVTAYGITVFLTEQWESCLYQDKKNKTAKRSLWKALGITAATLAVIVCCGSLGQPVVEEPEQTMERANAERVLEALNQDMPQDMPGEGICLWAPKEIMAWVRAYDGNIRLVYGRNIWDAALGAYTYETYTEREEILYLWMSNLEETGSVELEVEYQAPVEDAEALESEALENEASGNGASGNGASENETSENEASEALNVQKKVVTGEQCLELAVAAGVNRILLPGNILPEDLNRLETVLGVKASQVEGYYLLVLP